MVINALLFALLCAVLLCLMVVAVFQVFEHLFERFDAQHNPQP